MNQSSTGISRPKSQQSGSPSPLRIGLNLLYLIPAHVGGTQTYAEELMRGLAQVESCDDYVVFVNQEAAELPLPESQRFSRVVCPVRAVNRSERYHFEQRRLPRMVASMGIDVLHSPGYVCPLRIHCRNVVSIHDLNYLALRDTMPWKKRALLGWFIRQSARRADHIITVSDHSRADILQRLRVPQAKVTTIHEAPRSLFAESAADWKLVRPAYGLDGPYVTAFSSLQSHKNIPRLLDAYARLSPELPHRLVLIGHLPTDVDLGGRIVQLGIQDRVVSTGYVPDNHLFPLLSHADMFVFPSLYEGFGLPLLDAQRAGVAVASSNAASLPEVGGDGAIYFDPGSVTEIANSMNRVLKDPRLRQHLILRGQANLARFSWEKAAVGTKKIYDRLGTMIRLART